jgi:hypothetical protein
VVCSSATTLWHLNAAEWAPSTASKTEVVALEMYVGSTPEADILAANNLAFIGFASIRIWLRASESTSWLHIT